MKLRSHPELHGLPAKIYSRLFLRKKSRENIRAGLTWNGKSRQRPIRHDLAKLSRNARHVVTNRERRARLKLTKTGVPLTREQYKKLRADFRKRPFITTEMEIERLRLRLARFERLGVEDAEVVQLRFQCEAALLQLLSGEGER